MRRPTLSEANRLVAYSYGMASLLRQYIDLFMRLPEIHPRRMYGGVPRLLELDYDDQALYRAPEFRIVERVDETDAIAVCRCAVEDWLMVQTGYFRIGDSLGDVVVIAGSDRRIAPITRDATVHDALIAVVKFMLDVRAGVTR